MKYNTKYFSICCCIEIWALYLFGQRAAS